jgi:hypothetical protein
MWFHFGKDRETLAARSAPSWIRTEQYFMREAEFQQGIELQIMKGVRCVDRQAVDREAVDSPFVLDRGVC